MPRKAVPGEATRPGGAARRPSWDEHFMLLSETAALRSNCLTRRIGAVLVRDLRVISAAYNGTPAGMPNCHDGGCPRCSARAAGKIRSGEDLESCLCMHAEANAILHCTAAGTTAAGSTLYTTLAPCLECSKLLVTVGVSRVVCTGIYPESALTLLDMAGVTVERIDRRQVAEWAGLIGNWPAAPAFAETRRPKS